MRRNHRSTILFTLLLLCLSSSGAINAQDDLDLHIRIVGRKYRDDKIVVRLPDGWRAAIETDDSGVDALGLILRKGRYILRLCTSCGQASGVIGGRFGEIVGAVQPWFRLNMDNPSSCGDPNVVRVNRKTSRVDFWFHRDRAHVYREDNDDCREPKTTATVWYGSYFEENCLPSPEVNCGGYFLHHDWLTHGNFAGLDEMVFALTSDKDDIDQLPHRGDPELQQVLLEASSIVRSIHYRKLPKASHARE